MAKTAKPAVGLEGGKPESVARKAYAGIAAVVAGVAARKVVKAVWSKAAGKPPPEEPESPDVHWAEAIGWSALSGTAVAVARLLATRHAAGQWQRAASDTPTKHTTVTENAVIKTAKHGSVEVTHAAPITHLGRREVPAHAAD